MEASGPKESLLQHEEAQEITGSIPSSLKRGGNISAGRAKKAHLPPLESKPTPADILHALLPPRSFSTGEKKFIQYTSTTSASRSDVTKLKEALEMKLEERQALSQGICRVREQLYGQCFEELIRQISLDCPERGILLVRIRDDTKMTYAAYRTLYAHAKTYVMQKSLEAERGQSEAQAAVEELAAKKERLEHKKGELLIKKERMLNGVEERKYKDELARKDEIEFLDFQGKNMDTILKNIDKS